jgi:hypothetical protein
MMMRIIGLHNMLENFLGFAFDTELLSFFVSFGLFDKQFLLNAGRKQTYCVEQRMTL